MEMLFTGRRFTAAEAKHWGIVNEIVPAADLMARARDVAAMLAEGPPLVFAAIKETLRETMHLPVQQAFDLVTKRKLQRSTSSIPAKTSWKAPGLCREAQARLEGPLITSASCGRSCEPSRFQRRLRLLQARTGPCPQGKAATCPATPTGAYGKLVWVAGQLERDMIFIFH